MGMSVTTNRGLEPRGPGSHSALPNPPVGERLPGLIAAAGCRILDLVPLTRFPRPGTPLWEWPTGFFFGYVPRLVEAGLLTDAERLAFESEWREREAHPGAFLSPPPMVGIVAEKR